MNKINQKELKDPVIIEAEFIRESSKSMYFNCEGDFHWFPKSQIIWHPEDNSLQLERWLAKKTFPNENF